MNRESTPPRLPGLDEIKSLGSRHGMRLSDEDALAYREMMASALHSCHHVDQLSEPKPEVHYPRRESWPPATEENPFNAWAIRCRIEGAKDGPLTGNRVGVKDSFCLAGVPMASGSKIVDGFVPDVDATVVARLLDAGATIVGKTASASGVGARDGEPMATVRNPRKPSHAPGGSSTGSAAALAAGDIEMALGADQGGSIRIPASWSGVVGLKPTYGLVPYTGVVSNERTMTHPGPMANTVAELARMLNAIAGPDPLDPRCLGVERMVDDYTNAIGMSVEGLRLAIVREGFEQDPWTEIGLLGSEPEVDESVRRAVQRLQESGAVCEQISIPMHLDGVHIFNALYNEGNAHMYRHHNIGTNWLGFYNTKLLERKSWRDAPDTLAPSAKAMLIIAEYLETEHRGRYYAKAQNLRRRLVAAYDEVLSEFDALVMPTVPFRATKIPEGPVSPKESVAFAMQMINNTCQFGVTGHPAISVPCGMEDGLPIGLMIVGKHLDELTVLRVADALERSGPWQKC